MGENNHNQYEGASSTDATKVFPCFWRGIADRHRRWRIAVRQSKHIVVSCKLQMSLCVCGKERVKNNTLTYTKGTPESKTFRVKALHRLYHDVCPKVLWPVCATVFLFFFSSSAHWQTSQQDTPLLLRGKLFTPAECGLAKTGNESGSMWHNLAAAAIQSQVPPERSWRLCDGQYIHRPQVTVGTAAYSFMLTHSLAHQTVKTVG